MSKLGSDRKPLIRDDGKVLNRRDISRLTSSPFSDFKSPDPHARILS